MNTNASIDVLDLSGLSRNRLKRNKIFTIADLLLVTDKQLSQMENLGPKSIQEILSVIEDIKSRPEPQQTNCSADNNTYVATVSDDTRFSPDFSNINSSSDIGAADLIDNTYGLDTSANSKFSLSDDISTLGLSVRSYNCLKRNNIFTVGALLLVTPEQLSQMKNLGNKSIQEVLSVIEDIKSRPEPQQTNCSADNNTYVATVSDDTRISPDFSNISPSSDIGAADFIGNTYDLDTSANSMFSPSTNINTLGLSVRSVNCLVRNNLHILRDIICLTEADLMSMQGMGRKIALEILGTLEVIRSSPRFISNIHAFPEYSMLNCKNKLLSLLDCKYNGLDYNTILSDVSLHHISNDTIRNVLDNLVQTNVLIENDGIYTIKYLTVTEHISLYFKERDKDIALERLSGKTLEEIGEKFAITRERVRQIISRPFSKVPKLAENKYISVFETYDFSKEDFCKIFNEVPGTFHYLEIVCDIRSKTRKPLNDILSDDSIPVAIRKRAEQIIYKNYITIDGMHVLKSRSEIFHHIVKTNCRELIVFSDVIDLYNQFLEEHDLTDNPKLTMDIGSYKNKAQTCDYILWNLHHSMRYYNIPERDYSYLVDELCMEQYMGKEITSLKLFHDRPDLMNEYDIRDEYELHNLLKKIWDRYGNCNEVVFGKMPTITVGVTDVQKQVMDLLVQHAPIINTDLANLYEDMYGTKAATAMSNHFKCISQYYHNGMYSLPEKIMPETQVQHMHDILVNDFYTITDIRRIFLREYPDGDAELLSAYNIKLIGFNVYTDYVLKNTYPTAAYYFRHILTSDDIVDTTHFPNVMSYLTAYTSELYELRQARKITEFVPKQYINIRRLNEFGITKDTLEDYCSCVKKFTDEYKYFTVKQILNNGFYHELHELGFDNWFYSSVIIADLKSFSYLRVGGTHIISQTGKNITVASIVEWLVEKLEKIEIYDLVELLNNDYGIKIDRYTLTQSIRETSLYYDSIMDTVYVDYDTYFEEI